MPSPPKDFTGREFEINDLIVYPQRRGSALWMNLGRVAAIEHSLNKYGYPRVRIRVKKDTGEEAWLSRLDNCTVVGHWVDEGDSDCRDLQ